MAYTILARYPKIGYCLLITHWQKAKINRIEFNTKNPTNHTLKNFIKLFMQNYTNGRGTKRYLIGLRGGLGIWGSLFVIQVMIQLIEKSTVMCMLCSGLY